MAEFPTHPTIFDGASISQLRIRGAAYATHGDAPSVPTRIILGYKTRRWELVIGDVFETDKKGNRLPQGPAATDGCERPTGTFCAHAADRASVKLCSRIDYICPHHQKVPPVPECVKLKVELGCCPALSGAVFDRNAAWKENAELKVRLAAAEKNEQADIANAQERNRRIADLEAWIRRFAPSVQGLDSILKPSGDGKAPTNFSHSAGLKSGPAAGGPVSPTLPEGKCRHLTEFNLCKGEDRCPVIGIWDCNGYEPEQSSPPPTPTLSTSTVRKYYGKDDGPDLGLEEPDEDKIREAREKRDEDQERRHDANRQHAAEGG